MQDKIERGTKDYVRQSHVALKKEFSGLLQDVCLEFKKQFASNKNNFESINDKVISEIEKLKEDNSMIYQALTGLNQRLEKTEMNIFRYECDHEDFKLKLDEHSQKMFILSNEQEKRQIILTNRSAKKIREVLSGKKKSVETPEKNDADENLNDKDQIVDAVEDIKETQEDMNEILLDITNRFVKLEDHVLNTKHESSANEISDLNTKYDLLNDEFKNTLEMVKAKIADFTSKSEIENLTESIKENLDNMYDDLKKIEAETQEFGADFTRELTTLKSFNQKFVTSEHLTKSVELLELKIKSELNYAYNMEMFKLKGSSNSCIRIPKSSEKKQIRDSSPKQTSQLDNNYTLTNNETQVFRELVSNLNKQEFS